MVKKIICFVGVVAALLSVVLVPVSAATTLENDVTISNWSVSDGVGDNGTVFACSDCTVYVLTGVFSGTYPSVDVKVYTQYQLYIDFDGVSIDASYEPITIRFVYNSSNVTSFNYPPAINLGFTFNGYTLGGFTQEDLDNARQEGYNQGLEEGNQVAYDEGYAQGVIDGKADYAEIAENNGKVNFFAMPQFKVSVSCLFSGMVDNNISTTDYVNKTYINNDLQFVYSNGKLVLPTIRDEIVAFIDPFLSDRSSFENIVFDFYFERSSNLYEDNFFPKTQNVGLNVDLSLIPNSGIFFDRCNMTSFECFIPVDGQPDGTTIGQVNTLNQGVFAAADLNKVFTHMQFELTNSTSIFFPQWLENNLAFTTNCVGYSSVYQDGYIVGYEDGITEVGEDIYLNGFQTGLAEGYENGYIQGKADGINVSENGNFVQLFTAVAEAPVNAFTGLFDFEILGLDMRGAFGAILALCVVLIVIKKVVF